VFPSHGARQAEIQKLAFDFEIVQTGSLHDSLGSTTSRGYLAHKR
jgi:hypothetical protein